MARKRTRWTEAGKFLRKDKPSLFSVSNGFEPRGKGGPHKTGKEYNRAQKRREEQDISRGGRRQKEDDGE